MLKSHGGHKFILCVVDEVSNYLITKPIHQARSEEIGRCVDRQCYIKICDTRIYDNGSRKCIYVYNYELSI